MSKAISLRRALPTTMLLHVLQSALGMALATSLGLELARGYELGALPSAARVAGVEHVVALAPLLRSKLIDLALVGVATALLSPWLQTTWLASLSSVANPLRALSLGLAGAPRAVLTSLFVGLAAAAMSAPFLAAGHVIFHHFEDAFDARTHLLLVASVMAPLLPIAAWAALVHDLARAASLREGPLRSTRRALRAALRPRVALSFLAWLLLGQGCVVLALASTSRGLPLSPWAALGVAHALLFGRSLARGMWLARALHATDPEASASAAAEPVTTAEPAPSGDATQGAKPPA